MGGSEVWYPGSIKRFIKNQPPASAKTPGIGIVLTMRTVPGYIATLLNTQPVIQASISSSIEKSGRLVGARTELDLDSLSASTNESVVEAVLAYHSQCLDFQDYLIARKSGYKNENRPAMQIRRPLTKTIQLDRKGGRKDLTLEMDALSEVPVLGQFVLALLDSKSSSKRQPELDRLTTALGAKVENLPDNKTVAIVAIPTGDHPWGVELGGAATPGEVSRVFTVTTSHAAWRDRRVRRLLSVEILVDELWAHPLNAAANIARSIPAEMLTRSVVGQ